MVRVGFGKMLMAAAIAALFGVTTAKADLIVFGSFQQTDPNAKNWSYSNNGATNAQNTLSISPANLAVSFTSSGGVDEVLNYTGAAVANLTATATGTATSSGGQVSEGISGTLAITNGTDNILTMMFTGALVSGTGGGSTGNLSETDVLGTAITYSSNHLVGSFIAPFAFSISLNGLATLAVNGNGYLDSFTGAATGNFSSDSSGTVPTPLPAAVWGGLSLMGAVGSVGAWRRRRR